MVEVEAVVEVVVEAEVLAEGVTVVGFVEGVVQGAEADLVAVAVLGEAEGDGKTMFLYFI